MAVIFPKRKKEKKKKMAVKNTAHDIMIWIMNKVNSVP